LITCYYNFYGHILKLSEIAPNFFYIFAISNISGICFPKMCTHIIMPRPNGISCGKVLWGYSRHCQGIPSLMRGVRAIFGHSLARAVDRAPSTNQDMIFRKSRLECV